MDEAAANASLDNDFGDNAGASAPATHYVALFRDDTYAEELTLTGGIDRFPIPNDSTHWPAAAGAEKTLTLAAPVDSDPSTSVWAHDATAWALMDAATGGNRWQGDECDPISNDAVGTILSIEDGALTISIDTD